jgi:hypothetical protein
VLGDTGDIPDSRGLKAILGPKEMLVFVAPKGPSESLDHRDLVDIPDLSGQTGHRASKALRDPLAYRGLKVPAGK